MQAVACPRPWMRVSLQGADYVSQQRNDLLKWIVSIRSGLAQHQTPYHGFLLLLLFCLGDMIFLGRPGWHQTPEPPALVSGLLGLEIHVVTPDFGCLVLSEHSLMFVCSHVIFGE